MPPHIQLASSLTAYSSTCITKQCMFAYSHSTRSAALQTLRGRCQQKRYAKVLDVRFLQTHSQTYVAEKYKKLLEQKAKSEGLSSVDELKEAYKGKIQDYKREALAPPKLPGALRHDGVDSPQVVPQSTEPTGTTQRTSKPKKSTVPSVPSGVKRLSSYIDTEKILKHDAKEIEVIWRARHVDDQNSLCAVIPYDTYCRIEKAAKKHPMFILPLPRPSQGIEMHFLQWQFTSPETSNVMFTSLVEYKLKGEYAQPHTTITHHLDLVPEKNLVLLHGQVMEKRGVSVDEAKWLMMALQKFYGDRETDTSSRGELLRMFSEGKTEFDVGRLIQEVETIN